MKEKICNQFFVKDIYRDKTKPGTAKCANCLEKSNFEEPFPFELKKFNKWMSSFVKLHSDKGCNKIKLNGPEWASSTINVAIVN